MLNVNLLEGMSLEEVMKVIIFEVEFVIMVMMFIDGVINYGGSVDSLKGVIVSMVDNFFFVMVLLLLLMVGLFKLLKDSVLVVFFILLVMVGGVIVICIMNIFIF